MGRRRTARRPGRPRVADARTDEARARADRSTRGLGVRHRRPRAGRADARLRALVSRLRPREPQPPLSRFRRLTYAAGPDPGGAPPGPRQLHGPVPDGPV